MKNSGLEPDIEKRLTELQTLSLGNSEADVREDFLTPLLELLGYKSTTTHNIEREVPLLYPKAHQGKESTKFSKYPDYMLSVDKHRKWVLEAKKKAEYVSDFKKNKLYENISQVYSYANHKEIQVEFYALCNGDKFALYRTQDTDYEPIFKFERSQLLEKWNELSNLLSVKSFQNNNKDVTIIFKQIIPESLDDHEKEKLIKWILLCVLRKFKLKFSPPKVINNSTKDKHTDFYIVNSDKDIGLIRYIYNKNLITKNHIQDLTNLFIDDEINTSYIYLVTTTSLDKEATEFIAKRTKKYPDDQLIVVGSETLSLPQLLMEDQKFSIPSYKNKCKGSVDTITLLATENKELYWAVEEIDEKGEPYRVLIFHTKNCNLDMESLKLLLNKHKLFVGCSIEDGNQGVNEFRDNNPRILSQNQFFQTEQKINTEIPIPPIPIAENFESDSACDPKDFIGREKIKEEFWDFINDVQNKKTLKRVFTLEGKSGYGKSSFILKLEQESKNKDDIFLYQVDIRLLCQYSEAAFIVASAIRKAIQEAIDQNFINLPGHTVSISRERLLFHDNQSMSSVKDYLDKNHKIFIICFDQFDYLFSRNEFLDIYKAFASIVTEVNSLRANFVLGFSCRQGIPLIENTIRDEWSTLKDIREVFEIKEFNDIESKEYLKKFSQRLKKDKKRDINHDFKKWLQEHCAGFPYLFRQICSSIYKNSDNSFITHKKLEQLIENIFTKQIEDLHHKEKFILRKIAKDENILGLEESYEKELKSLVEKKFLLCSGTKYLITSDIRKEYYSSGKFPEIPTKYIPKRMNVTGSLYAMRDINKFKSKQELINKLLVDKLKYEKSTADSIWIDIQNIFYIEYDLRNDKITVPEEFDSSTEFNLKDYQIADYLSSYFQRNLIIKKILQEECIKNLETFDRNQFKSVYNKIAVDGNNTLKKDSTDDYASRLLTWLCFAGLIEFIKQTNRYRVPSGSARNKGKILECGIIIKKHDIIANNLFPPEQLNLF